MKRTYSLIFILSLSILLFTSLKCRKDKNEAPDTLPPITQTGANTFGCKVDGKIWAPYAKCGFGNNPCGEMSANVQGANMPNSSPFNIELTIGKESNNELSFFNVSTYGNNNFPITSVGNKIDSISFSFVKSGSIVYRAINGFGINNSFIITKLDTINRIISGIFDITLYKSLLDSVRITEGRFDLKFSVCKCSN